MQAGRFLSVVKNVTDLRTEELDAAKDLLKRYPYSQLLQLIVARGARDRKGTDEQSTLHRAAVYATDRTVLKAVMTRVVQPRVEALPVEQVPSPLPSNVESKKPVTPSKKTEPIPAEPAPVPAPAAPKVVETKKQAEAVEKKKPELAKPQVQAEPAKPQVHAKPDASAPIPPVTLEGDALRADLKSELSRLQELMSKFDATYEQIKKGRPSPQAATKTPDPEPVTPTPPTPAAVDAPLIEEIKTSKRKPKLVSPKVAEQGEIIDKFIKVAPTLPRTKPTQPLMDLSEETTNYGDNIVSETLVEILIHQGKKEKAIEMLKKLIWKFPQKKAYFAAQIEALKS